MGLISWFKNLFSREEEVKVILKEEVKVITDEVSSVVEEVKEVVAEVAEKVAEVSKEEPTKKIEERLAEVSKEEKVTAKEIKAKAKTPAKEKTDDTIAEVNPVKVAPKPRKRPARKNPKGE